MGKFIKSICGIVCFAVAFGASIYSATGPHIEATWNTAAQETGEASIMECDASEQQYEPLFQAGLNGSKAEAYDAIALAVSNMEPTVEFAMSESNYSKEVLTKILRYVNANPEFFWVDTIEQYSHTLPDGNGNIVITVKLNYVMDKEERDRNLARIETIVQQVQNEVQKKNYDATEASKYVDALICVNTEYGYMEDGSVDMAYEHQGILGPMLMGKGICSGYANTYAYLMMRLGCSAEILQGHTNSGIYHAWSAITLENGDLVYTDTTYNDNNEGKYLNCDAFSDRVTEVIYKFTPVQ